MKTAVIVLTCNATAWLDQFIPALQAQTPAPDEVLVIDSSSNDTTVSVFCDAGYRVQVIPRGDFNHGGTRRLATELVDADVYVFLTQDALLCGPEALMKLVTPFDEYPDIGLSYGRQLPHVNARPLGGHARLFNYPDSSRTKSLADAGELGIKTCFASDSFAAYRRTALDQVGGFPPCVIGTEDTYVAGRMLRAGWKVHYEAGACVYHSHDYALLAQFRRYFDIGVFYGRERWIAEAFGAAGGEGSRFAQSEVRYLIEQKRPWLIPYALLQNAAKLAGYRVGMLERHLPVGLKKRISMNSNFWSQDDVR